MPVFLNGLSLQFYRGIGSDEERMGPFKDFNFFIGANNSGKSTVLNFISESLPFEDSSGRKKSSANNPLHEYRGKVTGRQTAGIAIPGDVFIRNVSEKISGDYRHKEIMKNVETLTKSISENGLVWLRRAERKWELENDYKVHAPILEAGSWKNIWSRLTGASGGDLLQHWVPDSISKMIEIQDLSLPAVKIIPALRQIGQKGGQFSDFSGAGLIDRLAEVQSPDHDKRDEHKLFLKVNEFLQTVTGKSDARIEIPHHREHVLVHMDDKVLPLASLGMGIHEVIMVASFCTLTENSIVCIEEPEIHLHPMLQRKLIHYLRAHTNNQYFIATHSASFIDTPEAAIFHVSNDGNQTYIKSSILPSERHNICVDLGYKASDVVQSNAVIWVEGPSDRSYVKHWISNMAPDLIEGTHYSIMFYGGRLLSHVSAESDEITDFISLKSLNRHMAIVMDSDKGSAHARINTTKARLRDEISNGSGVSWLTKGREIENYIDPVRLQAAVKKVYATVYERPVATGPYDHALFFRRKTPKRRRSVSGEDGDLIEKNVDKVAVAKVVCADPAEFAVLDLRDRVNDLVQMIRLANT